MAVRVVGATATEGPGFAQPGTCTSDRALPDVAAWRIAAWSRAWLARRNALIRLGSGLVVAALALAGLLVWDLRGIVVADALSDADNLAVVFAEQTAKTIQAVDLVLREAQERVAASGATTAEQFRALGTRQMHAFLESRAERLPQVSMLVLMGADGARIANSLEWPLTAGNASGRDYVRHFAAGDDPALFISELVVSHATWAETVYVARRVNGPGGEFLGIVLAGIPLKALEGSFQSISLPRGESVTLLRRDGAVLARSDGAVLARSDDPED